MILSAFFFVCDCEIPEKYLTPKVRRTSFFLPPWMLSSSPLASFYSAWNLFCQLSGSANARMNVSVASLICPFSTQVFLQFPASIPVCLQLALDSWEGSLSLQLQAFWGADGSLYSSLIGYTSSYTSANKIPWNTLQISLYKHPTDKDSDLHPFNLPLSSLCIFIASSRDNPRKTSLPQVLLADFVGGSGPQPLCTAFPSKNAIFHLLTREYNGHTGMEIPASENLLAQNLPISCQQTSRSQSIWETESVFDFYLSTASRLDFALSSQPEYLWEQEKDWGCTLKCMVLPRSGKCLQSFWWHKEYGTHY